MNNKGLSLVELLAVIAVLEIVALITITSVSNVMKKARKNAFKDSVLAAMDSYTNNESINHFNDQGEIDIKNLPLDNNPFTSGVVKRNDDNEVIVIDATEGNYCANGSRRSLEILDGKCE